MPTALTVGLVKLYIMCCDSGFSTIYIIIHSLPIVKEKPRKSRDAVDFNAKLLYNYYVGEVYL